MSEDVKIIMPDGIYVFSDQAKSFFAAMDKITADDGWLEGFAKTWFYDAEKLGKDYPEEFKALLPFIVLAGIKQ